MRSTTLGGFATFLVVLGSATHAQDQDFVDGGRGPVPLWLPTDYDPTEPLPLIVALHGYSQNSAAIESYFNLVQQVEGGRFLYCVPQGTVDAIGERFWNATDACCDFFDTGVDDSGYLRGLVEAIQGEYAVDELSIHFMGYSNGGFMANRMACEHADLAASVISLAGRSYRDVSECSPSEPVAVLHISGTADDVIRHNGGCTFMGCYPSAEDSTRFWAGYDGCDLVSRDIGVPFDLDVSVAGNEASARIYDQNCDAGVSELWTLVGSDHGPRFWSGGLGEGPEDNRLAPLAVDWLLSHRKGCAADLTGDGEADSDDFFAFLDAFAGGDLGVCDLDDDGDCDADDFFAYLDVFAVGC